MQKICCACHEPKEIVNFTYFLKDGIKHYFRRCKDCRAETYRHKYHSNIANSRKYNRLKRQRLKKENPDYVIAHRLRMRVNLALKNNPKKSKTFEMLGCSLKYFKNYLESKFKKGMSWDALFRGEIHIDHIRPCSSFDLSQPQEQAVCFHYLNLQPLWAKDNLSKGAKLFT